MARAVLLAYAAFAYVTFALAVAWAALFLAGGELPVTVDSSWRGQVPWQGAVAIDLTLLLVFALQHSVMAGPAVKARVRTVVPVAVERSTYVLATTAALALLFWTWRPLPATVWQVGEPVLRMLVWLGFAAAIGFAIAATFLVDHSEFTGLRQAGWRRPATRGGGLVDRGIYAMVRHPMMLGLIVAFWATPTMTTGHLLFAAAATAYILVGIRLEEHDLTRDFGPQYRAYAARVPALVPAVRAGNRTGRTE